jgi:phage terminase small subunit
MQYFHGDPDEYQGVDLTGLKHKQREFCREYAQHLNGFKAARAVGYNEKHSFRLLKDPRISAYIAWLAESNRSSKTASMQEVMEYLTSVMRQEKVEDALTNKGEIVTKGVGIRDANKAAEMLAKHYGLLVEKAEVKVKQDFEINIVPAATLKEEDEFEEEYDEEIEFFEDEEEE